MAKYYYPPAPPSGEDTFSNNLVGLQFVNGSSQMTLGNFSMTQSTGGRDERGYSLGNFSEPINLSNLSIENLKLAQLNLNFNLQISFNYNLEFVQDFVLYGSLKERFRVSTKNIINFFPASLYLNKVDNGGQTGSTTLSLLYDDINDRTTLVIPTANIKNPFGIEITDLGVNKITLTAGDGLIDTSDLTAVKAESGQISDLRNFSLQYKRYVISLSGSSLETEYPIIDYTPIKRTDDRLTIVVSGSPLGTADTASTLSYYIKPNNLETQTSFKEFDEVENFLLNREIVPEYTAQFKVPRESQLGSTYLETKNITWPKVDLVNLDIVSTAYTEYLTSLAEIGDEFDSYKTNLVSRFLTTDPIKEFDTGSRKVEKTLQIYGRSFDDIKKFIDGIAYMTRVTYDTKNNIPDNLLKKFARMLGLKTPSVISKEDFLNSLLTPAIPQFSGTTIGKTPFQLDTELYRKILMNLAYLYKSKGTRTAIEFILRFVGAPEALIEFDEHVVIADSKINLNKFNQYFSVISGGSYCNYTYHQNPVDNTITTSCSTVTQGFQRDDYPMNDEGYPTQPRETTNYYFQRGAGWYEETMEHRGEVVLDLETSTFSGCSPIINTKLNQFTWGGFFGDGSKANDPGGPYLERFFRFPHLHFGYGTHKIVDDKKAWFQTTQYETREYDLGVRYANYDVRDEKLIINVKNVDIFLNIGQGLVYDVWNPKHSFLTGTTLPYPYPNIGGPDWTQPKTDSREVSFKRFIKDFWRYYINVKNRLTIDDGKTGGYPTLLKIYLDYLNQVYSKNNQYTYQKMIEYAESLGDYWIKLIEQFVPATTLWQGGVKIENSLFHRDKFVYKHFNLLTGITTTAVTGQTAGMSAFGYSGYSLSMPDDPLISGSTQQTSSKGCNVETDLIVQIRKKIAQQGIYAIDDYTCDSTWFPTVIYTGPQNLQLNGNARAGVQNQNLYYNSQLYATNTQKMGGIKQHAKSGPLQGVVKISKPQKVLTNNYPWDYNYIIK